MIDLHSTGDVYYSWYDSMQIWSRLQSGYKHEHYTPQGECLCPELYISPSDGMRILFSRVYVSWVFFYINYKVVFNLQYKYPLSTTGAQGVRFYRSLYFF